MAKKNDTSVYKINRLDQLEVLKSCLRDRICDVVCQAGQLTANEIATRLGIRPTAIYSHLDLLVEVGLLVEGDQVRTNKNFARSFGTPAKYMRFDRESKDPQVQEAIRAILASQLRQAAREFQSATQASSNPECDYPNADFGLGIAWLTAWLDTESIERAKALLNELDEIFMVDEPGPGKTLFALTYIARPVVRK
ncbi:MAG: helix-turn-helix domain-containing protein [Phycisphaerales bacterium]